jgi:hypothetical protein
MAKSLMTRLGLIVQPAKEPKETSTPATFDAGAEKKCNRAAVSVSVMLRLLAGNLQVVLHAEDT